MTKSKRIRMLPALLALCVALTACGGGNGGNRSSDGGAGQENAPQEGTSGADAGTDEGTNADGDNAQGEKVLNVVVGKPSVVEDMNTNETSLWLEETTGIHVNYEQLPLENLNEKIAMMLAGGELPDVFLNCNITAAQVTQYGVEDQYLIPLDDLIDQYAPNLIEAMEPFEAQGGMDLLREVDGHIYSLPTINPCFHCSRGLKMWVNDEWMQKLQLEYPTTTEEFKEMLIAFRDNDPNGNGLKDEIPLSGDSNGWYTQSAYFLLGAFLPMSAFGQGFGLDGSKVVNLSADERFRDALAYLNDLYSEGLMDAGTLTQTNDQLKKLVENPDAPLVGATTGGYGGQFTSEIGDERYRLYRPLAPLKGPEGVQYAFSGPYTPTTGNFVITKDCTDPALAMQWANALYTNEACNTINNGVEGKAWRYAEDGEVGSEGQPALWTALLAYTGDGVGSTRNDCWTQMGIYNFSAEWRAGQTVDPDVDLYSADGMESLLYKTTKEMYDQYNMDDYALPALKLTEDENFTVSPLRTEWNNYFSEMFFNFVTGAWNLESDWENHVKNMESVYSMSQILETYQTAYDRQYAGN